MHVNRRSARDEGGAVAILVAISLVVLCMSGAMAIDVGNLAQLHRHGEYTVDDAAISGADLLQQGTDSLTQIVGVTEGYIDENWRNLPSSAWDTCPDIPSGFSAPSGSLENCVTFNGTSTATASAINVEMPPQSVPFTLAQLGGFTSGTVEASASAVIEPGTAPCALCVLGPSGLTLNDTGSGSFNVSDKRRGHRGGLDGHTRRKDHRVGIHHGPHDCRDRNRQRYRQRLLSPYSDDRRNSGAGSPRLHRAPSASNHHDPEPGLQQHRLRQRRHSGVGHLRQRGRHRQRQRDHPPG